MKSILLWLIMIASVANAQETLEQRVARLEAMVLELTYRISVLEDMGIKAEKTNSITIHTLPNCEPCKRWLANEGTAFRKAGWQIKEVPFSSGSCPRWMVCVGDQCFPIAAGEWLDNLRMQRILDSRRK